MTRNKKFALFLLAASVFSFAAVSARAQEKKPKMVRFQVLHMMNDAIQVQSLVDQHEIHTFVYSDRIRGHMQALLKKGGYQFGDKVKIVYQPGNEIALDIRGKPSKPKTL